MKTNLLIFFILIATGLSAHCQKPQTADSLRITGVVLDKDSLTALPYTQFKLNAQNYLSNEEGQFSFWAKQGEIIKFSHLGFKDSYIKLSDTLVHRNYLFGVFLTRDTIEIGEIIVLPRYENLVAKLRYMPLMVTPESVYSNQNIRTSTYQALTQPAEKMDVEMNQRMVLKERTMSTAYKTQIPPDKSIGIGSDQLIPMMLYLSSEQKTIKQNIPQPMSQSEMDLLIELHEEQLKRYLRENNSE